MTLCFDRRRDGGIDVWNFLMDYFEIEMTDFGRTLVI